MPDLLRTYRRFVLDLDGVMYRGSEPRIGAREILAYLQESGLPFLFLTNTSVKTRGEIASKMQRLGFSVDAKHITTASEILASFIASSTARPSAVLTVGGGNGLTEELRSVDLRQYRIEDLSEDAIAEIVNSEDRMPLAVAWTRAFSYVEASRLLSLAPAIESVLASDDDRQYVGEGGYFPGTAWINGAVERLLERGVEVIGKPSQAAAEHCMRKLGGSATSTLVIGDTLASDIEFGKAAGCATCLVLGGNTSVEDLACLPDRRRPDYVVRELLELVE